MSTKCIILDLDHTIIQTIKTELDMIKKPAVLLEFSKGKKRALYLRNHLENFLDFCFNYYDYVVLWTAATEGYVELMLPYLPLNGNEFYRIITRDLFGTSQKNLDWFLTDPNLNRETTYFVDDIPSRIRGLPKQNIIVANKFDCQEKPDDDYLLNLIKILSIIT